MTDHFGVGFSGTRHGMSELQKLMVCHFLKRWALETAPASRTFRHGCCAGSDLQAHKIAGELGYKLFGHPGPRNTFDRLDWLTTQGLPFEQTYTRDNFHPRNAKIVEGCDTLLATPEASTFNAMSKGGTWYTIREGMKRGKSWYVILTNGNIHRGQGREHFGILIPGSLEYDQVFKE